LVQQGHEITLFASGDSVTQAHLVPVCPQSLRLDPHCVDQLAYHILLLEQVFQDVSRFDIIHFHIDYLHFPLSRRAAIPHLTTLHGRLDIPDLAPLYREFREMPLVSISNHQREPLPWLNWQGTVYHGLPDDLFTFHERPGRYLAFLGRISPEKRVDRAIQVAREAGLPIKIAAKVDPADEDYFESAIRPLLKQPHVEYIGEIGEAEKDELLGNAYALLFLIDWPEPFGLVMIEALACGTPVIAERCGSVPEVIEDGVTGYIVDDVRAAAQAVAQVATLSRRACRAVFEKRFTVSAMARNYVAIYERLVAGA
jgi:glycosyltransferase involved in cell wall biosynthesis